MKYFYTPKYLYEVFGKKQSTLEMSATAVFSIVGTLLIYSVFSPTIELPYWKLILGFILVADILAGCIANFTVGTNSFYDARPKGRILFISAHVHILAVAWLLAAPMDKALVVWGYTVVSAFLVNALKGKVYQRFIAANLLCYGAIIIILLYLPTWFMMVSMFFLIKVMFSFAVDHYENLAR